MKPFMDADFLLQTDTAKTLYHEAAEKMPIFDYHNHLNPQEILEDRQMENLTRVWLGGDHYKWRAMRAMGFSEDLITGNADDYDKYLAFAETIENAIGNPLYHWTHLELQR
ncbi:MAG: glucuronate isomerase, partial [Fusicatenibacter saccharivorans]